MIEFLKVVGEGILIIVLGVGGCLWFGRPKSNGGKKR